MIRGIFGVFVPCVGGYPCRSGGFKGWQYPAVVGFALPSSVFLPPSDAEAETGKPGAAGRRRPYTFPLSETDSRPPSKRAVK